MTETSLQGFLNARNEPVYIVRLARQRVSIEWRNNAAGATSPPANVLSQCLSHLTNGVAQQRIALDETQWHFTLIERGSAVAGIVEGPSLQQSPEVLHDLIRSNLMPSLDTKGHHDFLRFFFFGFDWGKTELGPISSWSRELWQCVEIMLLLPSPCMIIYGSFPGTNLYNWPYSHVAGPKHPSILGQQYHIAWKEVWPQISHMWADAWAGQPCEGKEMPIFLSRGSDLEETFFDFAMTPIIEGNQVRGVWHPLTEASATCFARRRLSMLNNLATATSSTENYAQFWSTVVQCLRVPDIASDLPQVAIYAAPSQTNQTNRGHDDVDEDTIEELGWRRSDEPLFEEMRRRGSDVFDSLLSERMELVSGFIEGANFPAELHLMRPLHAAHATPAERLLRSIVRRLHKEAPFVLLDESDTAILFGKATQREWPEDTLRRAVVCGLESSAAYPSSRAEQPLTAIVIFALNTRQPLRPEYEGFIRVLASHISSGLSVIRSTSERVLHAHYLAYTKHIQHEELKVELEKRTRDLQLQELQFSRLVSLVPAGIVQIRGPEQQFHFVNEAWYQISGHPRHLPPEQLWDSLHPDDIEAVRSVWTRVFENPPPADGEQYTEHTVFRWQGQTPAGHERWCSSLALIERGPDGHQVLTAVMSDLSHAKYAEQVQRARAEDAEQQKARLNSMVDYMSHELRNPLSAISSGIELISDQVHDFSLPDGTRKTCEEELNSIIYCLRHIQRLVDESLMMSKTDHDLSLHVERFSPADLARQTMRMFASELREKDITNSLTLSPSLDAYPELLCDAGRIRQVLLNFLTNAIKFVAARPRKEVHVSVEVCTTRPRLTGAVAINVEADHDMPMRSPQSTLEETSEVYLRFDVQDTGIGLDEQQQAMLFRKFEQAFGPKTERHYGSGLGLYFCRKITASLGGQCGLQSMAGVGSTFSFFVACKRPAAAMAVISPPIITANQTNPVAIRPLRVLVVEDNLINQRLLVKQLQRVGCSVTACDDGQHALDVLFEAGLSRPWDVCCLDVFMPKLNGLECASHIRAAEKAGTLPLPPLPIIGVSANARQEQRAEMLEAGMDATLPKRAPSPLTLCGISHETSQHSGCPSCSSCLSKWYRETTVEGERG